MNKFIKINNIDNVAIALTSIVKGEIVNIDNKEISVSNNIGLGNKIAIANIRKGQDVIKYGYPIGAATEDILIGSLVHTHNIVTKLNDISEYEYKPEFKKINLKAPEQFFNGYLRENGSVGVRNEIWIIPMVGCVNSVCRLLEKRANKELINKNIDNIITVEHQFGCSQLGEDHLSFQKMLSGLAHNPNAGGVLFVALGCENNTIDSFIKVLGHYDNKHIKFIKCQDYPDEIEEGIKVINELIVNAKDYKREKISVDKLVIGLKCGGSDGLSGITANPVIGAFSDILISNGGTTILTEVPEMFGAEQLLMNRCKDEETFISYVNMINGFKKYYSNHNQPIYENPSPGNKEGGITTLEEKSLGCVLKGGNAKIEAVLNYCDTGIYSGLNVMSAPGNDLIAATALAAAGAQIILFSTGRGTPFSTVVPTVKISTNTELALKKKNWIDFNAGELLNDGRSIEDYGTQLYDYVIKVASGEKVKSELNSSPEIAFWKNGVTL